MTAVAKTWAYDLEGKPVPGAGLHRDRYHRYTWNGDGPLVGVTTPLKIQDTLIGGSLPTWAGNIAVDYFLDTLQRWRNGGPSVKDADALRSATLAKIDEARDIGTAVHARIEHILVGEPQSQVPCPRHPPEFGRVGACALLPELVPPYIYAFTSWMAKYRPKMLLVEFMVVNLKARYAGTGDIACLIGMDGRDRRALIDVKTGKPKATHRLQLAGLAAAEFVGEPGNPEPIPLPKFQDYYTLLLRPDGYELVQHDVTRKDRAHFLKLVKTYRALREWEAQ